MFEYRPDKLQQEYAEKQLGIEKPKKKPINLTPEQKYGTITEKPLSFIEKAQAVGEVAKSFVGALPKPPNVVKEINTENISKLPNVHPLVGAAKAIEAGANLEVPKEGAGQALGIIKGVAKVAKGALTGENALMAGAAAAGAAPLVETVYAPILAKHSINKLSEGYNKYVKDGDVGGALTDATEGVLSGVFASKMAKDTIAPKESAPTGKPTERGFEYKTPEELLAAGYEPTSFKARQGVHAGKTVWRKLDESGREVGMEFANDLGLGSKLKQKLDAAKQTIKDFITPQKPIGIEAPEYTGLDIQSPKRSVGAAGQDITTPTVPRTELPKEPLEIAPKGEVAKPISQALKLDLPKAETPFKAGLIGEDGNLLEVGLQQHRDLAEKTLGLEPQGEEVDSTPIIGDFLKQTNTVRTAITQSRDGKIRADFSSPQPFNAAQQKTIEDLINTYSPSTVTVDLNMGHHGAKDLSFSISEPTYKDFYREYNKAKNRLEEPSPDQALMEEAKKYKTAEEFVESIVGGAKDIPAKDRPVVYVDDIAGMADGLKPYKTVGDIKFYDDGSQIIAKKGNKEVGYIGALSETETDLSVAQEFQKQGIGKKLTSEFFERYPEMVKQSGGFTPSGRATYKSQLTDIWNKANLEPTKKSIGARGKDIPEDSIPVTLPEKIEINTLDGKQTIEPKPNEPFTVDAIQKPNGKVEYQLHDGKALDISAKEARRIIGNYKQGDVLAEIDRIFEEPQEPQKPLGRKILELGDKAATAIYREFQPLNRYEADIYKAYGLKRPNMPLANKFELVAGAGGKASLDRIVFGEKVIKPIQHLYERDVDKYFFIKRAIDRLTHDVEGRKVGTWTVEKAQEALRQLQVKLGNEDFAKLEAAAQEYQKLMDESLQLQVQTGGMSPEEYASIKALNDFYAPFEVIQRNNEREYTGSGKSISGAKKLTKAIKGISRDDFHLKNIITKSLEQITMGRILAEKRLAMQELDALANIDVHQNYIKREVAESSEKVESLNNRLVRLEELAARKKALEAQLNSLENYRRSLYGKQVGSRREAREAAKAGVSLESGPSKVESRISLSPLFNAGQIQTPEMRRVWKQQISEIKKAIKQEEMLPEAYKPFLAGLKSEMEAYIESTPDIAKALRKAGGLSIAKEAKSWGLTGEMKWLQEFDNSLFNNKHGMSLHHAAEVLDEQFGHLYPSGINSSNIIDVLEDNARAGIKYTQKDINLLDRVLSGKVNARDRSAVQGLLDDIDRQAEAFGEPVKAETGELKTALQFAKGKSKVPVVSANLARKLTILEHKLKEYRETSLSEQSAMLDEVRDLINSKDITITDARNLLKNISGQLAAEKVNVEAAKTKGAVEKGIVRSKQLLRSKRFKDLEDKIQRTQEYLNRVAKGSIIIQDKSPLPEGFERVSFLKNGNVVTLQVRKDVADAVKGLNAQQQATVNFLIKMGAQSLRWGATGANAGFQFFNALFRDPLRLLTISKMGVTPLDVVRFPIEWIHSLYSAIRLQGNNPNELAREFLERGMGGGTAADYFDPKAFEKKFGFKKDITAKELAKKVVSLPQTVLDYLAKMGNVGEQTTKLLGYKRGKRVFGIDKLEGESQAAAIKELAWEVRNMLGSPDFAQGGTQTKRLNPFFNFLNARTRAISTDIARLGGAHGAKAAGAAWARLGLLIGLPTTILMLRNMDEDNREDYMKRPEWERKNYWLWPRYDDNGQPLYFKNEDGDMVREYYRWPKNDISQMLANSIEGGILFAYNKEPSALKELGIELAESISPVNIEGDNLTERTQSVLASVNPVISAPISWATNTNLRLHSDIVPMGREKAYGYLQYRKSTPEFYKTIGRMTATKKDGELTGGISPAKLEHAVSNLTGGAFSQFVLPEKVEGRSPLTVLPVTRRMFGGTRIEEPVIKDLEEALQKQASIKVKLIDRAREFIDELKALPTNEREPRFDALTKQSPLLAEKVAEIIKEQQKGFSLDDVLLKQLGVENWGRATWLFEKTKNMSPADRDKFLTPYWERELITDTVYQQLKKLYEKP